MTCTAATTGPFVNYLPRIALFLPIPVSTRANDQADVLTSGHHDFLDATTPFFNMQTPRHDFGTVATKKDSAVDAPAGSPRGANGLGSVPWLKLNGVQGRYKEVYRVDTAGGVAPKTCEGLSATFEVQYAALYYMYA